MQCNCGGSTKDHDVTRNKVTVGVYAKCEVCGRICWRWQEQPEQKNEGQQQLL